MEKRNQYSEKKKGLIGTIIFHSVVLILLLFLGFFTPLPLPGEEGILVNFGDSETGLGDREPSPARNKKQTPPPPKAQQKQATPPPAKTTPPPPTPKPKPQPAKEVAMTQDYEKTVAINAADKKKEEEEKRRQEELEEQRKQQAEAEAKAKEEAKAEAERLAEIKRKQQEEADRKAREEAAKKEAERLAREEEQRRINEINSRTAGAFSKSGSGSGGTGSSDGQSQGVTFPGGNQGVPTGDPNANKYGPGGSGSGDAGSGVSFSLSGRSIKSIAKPTHPGGDAGKVIVQITVDPSGNVVSALPGIRGSTIQNQNFLEHAKQAALKTKFSSKDISGHQTGTITYIFKYE